ncbi:MAG: PqqD family protein [Gammaproteobacteria bacterium]|nr:PqqD family protein [Gammaproteobacteria bacterium]
MFAARVHISPDALFQEIGGEGVILDLASSTYFGLDGVGVRFWQLLQENPDLQAARDALLAEFEVEADKLELDLDNLVQKLVSAELASVE